MLQISVLFDGFQVIRFDCGLFAVAYQIVFRIGHIDSVKMLLGIARHILNRC